MRAASTLTAIGTALLFAASSAHGLGFGRVVNATQLGQPLNFAATLRLDPDESLGRECVSAEVQSGDNKLAPAAVRTTLEGAGESERSVRVTTSSIIDEPVVTISVTVGCTAKITRKFVAFIDPPLINLPDSSSTQATLPPQRNDNQVAPLVTLVEGERPTAATPAEPSAAPPRPPRAERPAAPRARQRVVPPRAVASTQPVEAPTAPRPPRSTPPRQSAAGGTRVAAANGPRLKLEAPPSKAATAASAASMPLPAPAVPVPPVAVASAPPEAASAAAGPSEQTDRLAAERERIRLLEEGLNKLRADSQATQNTIGTLQAKLKDAESQRYANPLVYGLAWLSALLALAMLGLLWRQARVRSTAQWWTTPAPTPAPSPTPAAPAPSAGAPSTLAEPRRLPSDSARPALPPMPPHLLDDPTTGAGSFGVPTVIEEDSPARTGYAQTQVPTGFQPTLPAPATSTPSEPVRELSVEELIDLEQQAEFFIVLGQDEAAIELLMSHVRTDGGISPLPYLKLLEIYRRRGESDAYERIRDRFNRRFNAYAPDWDADLQQGRTLEDYPETVSRLQGLWATPTRAMETLDASLFRRNKTDETFDLPAYRELLFLYSVSRDLAEHGGSAPIADVDVLLPLSDDPNAEPISRLSATPGTDGGFRNSDLMTMPLDLDVSFPDAVRGAENVESAETRPAALRRSADQPTSDSGFIDFDLDQPYEPKKKS